MKARKVVGGAGVKPLERVSPARDKWRVRWDITPDGDGNASYMEAELEHRPTVNKIRTLICGWINDQTTEKIRTGFEYGGHPVWLSMENQANYKAAHDLAVQTGGNGGDPILRHAAFGKLRFRHARIHFQRSFGVGNAALPENARIQQRYEYDADDRNEERKE